MRSLQLPAVVLMLLSGATGFIRAETETFLEAAVGGNITVGCYFLRGGHTKIFCKDDCEKEGNVLIETSEDNRCDGRYCIKYNGKQFKDYLMFLTISNVTESDSGQYNCLLKRSRPPNGNHKFKIEITKNVSKNPTYTLKPEDFWNVNPTTQPGVTASANTGTTTAQESTRQPLTPGSTALYVGIALATVVVLLAAALLLFFCNRKSEEQPGTTEYDEIPEPNIVYEEIQDLKNSGSRPVQISTASASFSKPAEDQPSNIYSLATAPTNQLQTEDSASVTYIEVDLPKINSAPRRQTEAVLYSTVQTRNEDTLYSNVSAAQQ